MSTYSNLALNSRFRSHDAPQSYYTDPAWFQRKWKPFISTCGSVQGAPARSLMPEIIFSVDANASVIITRDEQSNVRAFHNVCRHRGTMLCKQAQGKFTGRIQCQYHA